MKLLLAHRFQEIFAFGQNLKHVHLTYAFHELLIFMIFFWLTLVTLFKVWFPNVSKKYCTQIHTLNDKIKTKGYTFSPVSDVNIEESCFFFGLVQICFPWISFHLGKYESAYFNSSNSFLQRSA